MTSTPERLTGSNTPELELRIDGHKLNIEPDGAELAGILCGLTHGEPVLIEQAITGPDGKNENRKVLFLSDGNFSETGCLYTNTGRYGSAIATLDNDGKFNLIHKQTSAKIIQGNMVSRSAVKSITIGEPELLTSFDAICALKFAEDSLFVDTKNCLSNGQTATREATIEVVTNLLDHAIGGKTVKVKINNKWKRIKREGVKVRNTQLCDHHPDSYMVETGHVIDPDDLLVLEGQIHGKKLGFLKLLPNGSALFLPKPDTRDLAELAFNPDFTRQFYPQA